MKQLGDITKINGAEIEPVNIVIGGSPCQNFSIAGNRQGLEGSESGLFVEYIRVIKEMRERDKKNGRTGKDIRPRYIVFENVTGLFSSCKGRDFQAVLTEFVRLAEPTAPDVPLFGGEGRKKWSHAGCLMGMDGQWSLAYRVFDSQFWGVPQRRKRISLILDLGGPTAPEVLFERKGMSRNLEQGETKEKDITRTSSKSVRNASTISFQESTVIEDNNIPAIMCIGNGQADISNHITYDVSQTLNCMHDAMAIMDSNKDVKLMALQSFGEYKESDSASALKRRDYKDATDLVIKKTYQDKVGTLMASGYEKLGTQEAKNDMYIVQNTVRRLTPLECERLQGLPDHWTRIGKPEEVVVKDYDIKYDSDYNVIEKKLIGTHKEIEYFYIDSKGKRKKVSDSARYKAIGNGIALPPWRYVLTRLNEVCGDDKTMGSCFDGIGSFDLIWSELNGMENIRWISEIDEFPMAVTKERFNIEL